MDFVTSSGPENKRAADETDEVQLQVVCLTGEGATHGEYLPVSPAALQA